MSRNKKLFSEKSLSLRISLTSYEILKRHLVVLKSVATSLPTPLSNHHHIHGQPIWAKSYFALALSWVKTLLKYLRICIQYSNVAISSSFSRMLLAECLQIFRLPKIVM